MATETTAERDARALHDDGEVHPSEIAIGVVIGRTSEAFDFFVFAIASVIVFPKVMFPFADPVTATLYSFAVFALAFMARPVGTLFFLGIDRRYGRGVKLTGALFLLGCSTAAMAFMPAYATVGTAAIVLLAILRLGQGFALGGTWDGLAALLAINAPRDRKGLYTMIPQLGAPLGLFLATVLFLYLSTRLTEEDFLAFGWRYPFFVAFAINVVALFARLRIVVTPHYQQMFETNELQPARIRDTLASNGTNVLIGAFVPLATFALFHMVTVFPLSWVNLYSEESVTRFLGIEMAGALVLLIAVIASGLVVERVGRKRLLTYSAIAIGIFAVAAPLLLGAGGLGATIYMIAGSALLGLSFGQSSGAVADRFDSAYRYTGSALVADLAWLFGAGFAPLVALLLSTRFGLVSSGLYLLSGAICSVVALSLTRRQR